MDVTQSFMDKTDWVERYAWFGAMPDPVISPVDSLLDKNGIITSLGKQYIGEISRKDNNGSVYKTLRPSISTDAPRATTDSNDTLGPYPQIGLSCPGILPPLSAFTTLGRVIASIGIAIIVVFFAFC